VDWLLLPSVGARNRQEIGKTFGPFSRIALRHHPKLATTKTIFPRPETTMGDRARLVSKPTPHVGGRASNSTSSACAGSQAGASWPNSDQQSTILSSKILLPADHCAASVGGDAHDDLSNRVSNRNGIGSWKLIRPNCGCFGFSRKFRSPDVTDGTESTAELCRRNHSSPISRVACCSADTSVTQFSGRSWLMRLYRLCRASYPAYDGEGARRAG
jgi:hypothetical protein